MNTIIEILKSKVKPKEKVTLLAKKVAENKSAIKELIACFENGSDSDRGNCMEAVEYAVEQDPSIAKHYLDFSIKNLHDKAPRVKWEAGKIIGNAAKRFPEETSKAISGLLDNTKDKGTVVRWSAAFALTEIAMNNSKTQKDLITKFESIVKKEASNGVKKFYIKALKVLQK